MGSPNIFIKCLRLYACLRFDYQENIAFNLRQKQLGIDCVSSWLLRFKRFRDFEQPTTSSGFLQKPVLVIVLLIVDFSNWLGFEVLTKLSFFRNEPSAATPSSARLRTCVSNQCQLNMLLQLSHEEAFGRQTDRG